MSTRKSKPCFFIDINKIKNSNECKIYIDEIIKVDKTQNLGNETLKENKGQTIVIFEDEAEEKYNENCYDNNPNEHNNNNEIYPNINNEEKQNLIDTDNSSKENSNNNINNYSLKIRNNFFNKVRANFYMKYKFYDVPLYQNGFITRIPEKYFINEQLFGFLYPDNYNTYCITKSGYLVSNNVINELDDKEINITKFDNSRGLYFCEKEIKIKNETKICAPNKFICKECMEINKKKYNIKDNYLININGRVAKINKRSYHCFGHFLYKTQIEDCISKFSCKACKLLDIYSSYYKNK